MTYIAPLGRYASTSVVEVPQQEQYPEPGELSDAKVRELHTLCMNI